MTTTISDQLASQPDGYQAVALVNVKRGLAQANIRHAAADRLLPAHADLHRLNPGTPCTSCRMFVDQSHHGLQPFSPSRARGV